MSERLPGPGTVTIYPKDKAGYYSWNCSCGRRGHHPLEDRVREDGLAHQNLHESSDEIRARVEAQKAEKRDRALTEALAYGYESLYLTNVHFHDAIDQMVPMTQMLVDAIADRSIKLAEIAAREIEAMEKGE